MTDVYDVNLIATVQKVNFRRPSASWSFDFVWDRGRTVSFFSLLSHSFNPYREQ